MSIYGSRSMEKIIFMSSVASYNLQMTGLCTLTTAWPYLRTSRGPSASVTSTVYRWGSQHCTICPRSSDPFYIVIYYIKWVTSSWTNSTLIKWWGSGSPCIFYGWCSKKYFKGFLTKPVAQHTMCTCGVKQVIFFIVRIDSSRQISVIFYVTFLCG